MKLCIWGGGGALAQQVIDRYLFRDDPWEITAVCRRSVPDAKYGSYEEVRVLKIPGMEKELSERGPFDAMVVMPGTVMNSKLQHMSDHVWHESISGNLTAAFKAMKLGLPLIKNDGSVVVVGSIIGSTGGYGCANYAAAKAGLVGLVRAAANENVQFGIRVNLLEAGYIDIGMGANIPQDIKDKIIKNIPLKRFAEPVEVLKAIDFLIDTPYMTGGVFTLSGGLR